MFTVEMVQPSLHDNISAAQWTETLASARHFDKTTTAEYVIAVQTHWPVSHSIADWTEIVVELRNCRDEFSRDSPTKIFGYAASKKPMRVQGRPERLRCAKRRSLIEFYVRINVSKELGSDAVLTLGHSVRCVKLKLTYSLEFC